MGTKLMTHANRIGKVNEPIRALRKIQTLYPKSIIAGGFYRDIYNDIPYSDIDIYIPVADSSSLTSTGWKNFFKLKVEDFTSTDNIKLLTETDSEYDVEDNDNIESVFEMIKNELKYNLILINIDPVKYVEEVFDFGICKTYCDGKKVTFTKEFISDVENKTLTFTDHHVSKSSFHHAMDVHFAKLKRKYPDYKLVIPEKHKATYKEYQSYTS